MSIITHFKKGKNPWVFQELNGLNVSHLSIGGHGSNKISKVLKPS